MIAKAAKKLEGVIPAPIVPLSEKGKVDFVLLEKQISYLIGSGVNGLFVSGTTGEGAYLARSEKLDILKAVKEIAAGRVFLCAACIQPSTPQVLEELEETLKLEPDFVVAVTPFYFAVSQEAICRHFLAVAERSPVPLIMYNIPSCTHNPMAVETIVELAQADNIAGLKDSSGDFVGFSRLLLAKAPRDFAWIMGEDYLDGPALMMGATGIVTGLSNAWAGFHVALYKAARAGDRAGMMENHAKINQLYGIHRVTGGKIIPVIKAAAAFFGRSSRWMKIPALTISEEEALKVRKVLEGMNLL